MIQSFTKFIIGLIVSIGICAPLSNAMAMDDVDATKMIGCHGSLEKSQAMSCCEQDVFQSALFTLLRDEKAPLNTPRWVNLDLLESVWPCEPLSVWSHAPPGAFHLITVNRPLIKLE